jgi:hypothetical protein
LLEIFQAASVVNIHREIHFFVAKQICDHLWMGAVAPQFRRQAVTEIVPATDSNS